MEPAVSTSVDHVAVASYLSQSNIWFGMGINTHKMILKVLTNAGKLRDEINTCSRENVLRANAAVLQDCRTADRTGGQDHFLVDVDLQLRRSPVGRVLDGARFQVV